MKPCNRVPEWREINAKDEKNPELLAQTDRQTIGPAWTRKFFSLFFFPQIYLIGRKLSPLVLASVWMGRLFVMLPLISNFMKGTWRWWRGEWGWWRGWGCREWSDRDNLGGIPHSQEIQMVLTIITPSAQCTPSTILGCFKIAKVSQIHFFFWYVLWLWYLKDLSY